MSDFRKQFEDLQAMARGEDTTAGAVRQSHLAIGADELTETNRPSPESVDKPIEVRCPACGCPVVEHRLYEDGVQVGERIECACGYKRQLGKEG